MLDHPEKVTLISVSYPPNEAALTWEVFSPEAYNEKVRISYLLSNIDRLVTYDGLATKDESAVDLKSYLVLRNFSGEDFINAKVLLDYGESFEKSIQHQETKRMLFFSARRQGATSAFPSITRFTTRRRRALGRLPCGGGRRASIRSTDTTPPSSSARTSWISSPSARR